MSEEQAEYKAQAAIQQKLAAMFSANKDEVSVPKIYIDMTDDYASAAVLDELLFWTLPKKSTGRTSLRVFKKGALWLAVRRKDWWDRKRLTERQADTAINKLIGLNLIEKDVFLFDGKPTVHLRMNMTTFVKMYGDKMQEIAGQEDDENLIRDISDLYSMMGFPNENVISNLQNGEMLNLQNGEFINSPVQPENNNSFFTAKESAENEQKWQEMMRQERQAQEAQAAGHAWRGRELLPVQFLIYGDWWHSKTGLHMYGAKAKAKIDTSWLKAFKEFHENDVTIASLDEAMKSNEWRTISNPAQIVNDAKAIQAAPKSVQSSHNVEIDSDGIPETY